nr:hypothetical protein [Bowmanella denitrificans]
MQAVQSIKYCPFCATPLPEQLAEQWFEELEKLGLEPGDDLPEALRSDRWWKDKNL